MIRHLDIKRQAAKYQDEDFLLFRSLKRTFYLSVDEYRLSLGGNPFVSLLSLNTRITFLGLLHY